MVPAEPRGATNNLGAHTFLYRKENRVRTLVTCDNDAAHNSGHCTFRIKHAVPCGNIHYAPPRALTKPAGTRYETVGSETGLCIQDTCGRLYDNGTRSTSFRRARRARSIEFAPDGGVPRCQGCIIVLIDLFLLIGWCVVSI